MAMGGCAEHGVWATTDEGVVAKAYGLGQRAYWETEKEAFERLGDIDVAVRFFGGEEAELPDGKRALLLFEENVPLSMRAWMRANKKKKLTRKNSKKFVEGVRKMHKRGVFHRDMHVENIRIREDGSVVLVDFGRLRTGETVEEMRWEDWNSVTMLPLVTRFDLGPGSRKKNISKILKVWE